MARVRKMENLPKDTVREAFANKWKLKILHEDETSNEYPYIRIVGKDTFIVFYSSLLKRGQATRLTKPIMIKPEGKLHLYQQVQLKKKVIVECDCC